MILVLVLIGLLCCELNNRIAQRTRKGSLIALNLMYAAGIIAGHYLIHS